MASCSPRLCWLQNMRVISAKLKNAFASVWIADVEGKIVCLPRLILVMKILISSKLYRVYSRDTMWKIILASRIWRDTNNILSIFKALCIMIYYTNISRNSETLIFICHKIKNVLHYIFSWNIINKILLIVYWCQ